MITFHSRAYIKIALITVIRSCLGVLKILAEKISRSVVCEDLRFLCAKILHTRYTNLNCYMVYDAKNLTSAYLMIVVYYKDDKKDVLFQLRKSYHLLNLHYNKILSNFYVCLNEVNCFDTLIDIQFFEITILSCY